MFVTPFQIIFILLISFSLEIKGDEEKAKEIPKENKEKPPKHGLGKILSPILDPVLKLITGIPKDLQFVIDLIQIPPIGVNLNDIKLKLPLIEAKLGKVDLSLKNLTSILKGGSLPKVGVNLGGVKLGLGDQIGVDLGGVGVNI